MSEKLKIVMIDDEPDLCMIVKDNLEATGKYDVVTSSSPTEAESLIQSESPGLILLDIVMPERNGPSVIDAIKKNEETKKIPIIILSGKGEMVYNKGKKDFKWTPNSSLVEQRGDMPDMKGAEALAEYYKVDDYVAKPFTTDLLEQVIEDVLAKYKKTDEADDDGESLI